MARRCSRGRAGSPGESRERRVGGELEPLPPVELLGLPARIRPTIPSGIQIRGTADPARVSSGPHGSQAQVRSDHPILRSRSPHARALGEPDLLSAVKRGNAGPLERKPLQRLEVARRPPPFLRLRQASAGARSRAALPYRGGAWRRNPCCCSELRFVSIPSLFSTDLFSRLWSWVLLKIVRHC